jgi:glucokinase
MGRHRARCRSRNPRHDFRFLRAAGLTELYKDRYFSPESMSYESQGGSGYVIGVDIGATNLRIGLADAVGKLVTRWDAPIAGATAPELVVQKIRTGVNELLGRTGVSRESLLAIAAGAPGVTDVDAGIVIATSYLFGWKNVPLRALLESELGIPAAVENDVRMGAIGEGSCGAAQGVRDFVFFAIGTGIAAGIFLNGEPFRGAEGSAGEVGYLIVPGTPEAAVADDEPGPLESVIGGEGIRAQWKQVCEQNPGRAQESLRATEIFDLAANGDTLAGEVLERSARILAYAIRNIFMIVNCRLFVLGGTVGMSRPLCDATERIIEKRNEQPRPRLVRSALGSDAQLLGAIRMALDKAASRAD